MMLGESNAQQGKPLQADLNMQRTYQPSATAIVRLPMQAQMSIMAEFWVNYIPPVQNSVIIVIL